MEAIVGMIVFFVSAIFWLIPVLVIAVSDRTRGGEKAAWILAVIFISWFAWIFYFLLAPLNDNRVRY